jgi:hypothetical protein
MKPKHKAETHINILTIESFEKYKGSSKFLHFASCVQFLGEIAGDSPRRSGKVNAYGCKSI